ncbi:MAG: hypothetical protein QXF12_05620 [Candidatus Aenigmatarchaeota archaeon]
MLSEKKNIICLKIGEKYPSIYVNNLFYMIEKNTMIKDYEFYCFTDNAQGLNKNINVIKIPKINNENIYGWFYKLSLFDKKINPLKGRMLYFDLDIVIISNIDCFIQCENDKLTILNDWIYKKYGIKKYNSSIMQWNIELYSDLFDHFQKITNIKKYAGDQDFITDHVQDVIFWPEEWCVSYKWHECEKGKIPENAKIIIFHGKPKPHELDKNNSILLNHTLFK